MQTGKVTFSTDPKKRIPLLRLKASGQRESHPVTRVATARNRLGVVLKSKVTSCAALLRHSGATQCSLQHLEEQHPLLKYKWIPKSGRTAICEPARHRTAPGFQANPTHHCKCRLGSWVMLLDYTSPRSQAFLQLGSQIIEQNTQTYLNKVNFKLLLQESHCAAECPQYEGEAGFPYLACGCVSQAVLHLEQNGAHQSLPTTAQQPCYYL